MCDLHPEALPASTVNTGKKFSWASRKEKGKNIFKYSIALFLIKPVLRKIDNQSLTRGGMIRAKLNWGKQNAQL